jgi:hypothetical protein
MTFEKFAQVAREREKQMALLSGTLVLRKTSRASQRKAG